MAAKTICWYWTNYNANLRENDGVDLIYFFIYLSIYLFIFFFFLRQKKRIR